MPNSEQHQYKIGDWVICGLDIGQVMEFRDNDIAEFSTGIIRRSGYKLAEDFRPLTLESKVVVQTFNKYYDKLRLINGEGGFNYPDISRYFEDLALQTVDAVVASDEKMTRECYRKMQDFVEKAEQYTQVIDGIRLFRPKR